MREKIERYAQRLEGMSTVELSRSAEKLVSLERRNVAALIAHLAEISRRKGHLELGYRRRRRKREESGSKTRPDEATAGGAAAEKKSRTARGETHGRSRYIPSSVRERVLERASYQCEFTGPEGVRCAARAGLEIDHIEPYAKGGAVASEENLRALCRAHNLYCAAREFGEDYVRRKIEGKTEAVPAA